MQKCIDTAVARNLQIRQRSLQAETAAVAYNQARNNRLPGVSADVQHGIQQGRSIDPFTNGYVNQQINYAGYSAGGDLTLFNGLSLKNSIRQNKLAADAAKLDEQQERDNVTLNVILAYLQVLNNEDLVVISKAQLAVTQEQVTRLEKLHKEGAISPPLLYDLRGQLKGEEVNVVNAQNAVETAKLTLTQLMNVPYDSSLILSRDGTETTITQYGETAESVYQTALQKLALVKAATLRTHSAEAGVKAARGLLYPTFSLNGNVNSNYSSVARINNLVSATDVATDSYVFINGNKTPVMARQNNYAAEKIGYNNQLKN
ncbi:MAG TPA: TolC family protein, partial [Niastella sp.]|nr:TolC family protein [Niastella sp.]